MRFVEQCDTYDEMKDRVEVLKEKNWVTVHFVDYINNTIDYIDIEPAVAEYYRESFGGRYTGD